VIAEDGLGGRDSGGHGSSLSPPGDGVALAEVRQLVVDRLRMRETELAEAVFAHVRSQFPDPVGDSDPEYVAGLRATVKAGIDYMLTGIELALPVSRTQAPSAALEQARRAARAGVSIDIVLSRYVAGHTLLGRYVMQELAHREIAECGIQPVELLGASAWLLDTSGSLLNRLTAPVTDAYRQEIVAIRRARIAQAQQAQAQQAQAQSAAPAAAHSTAPSASAGAPGTPSATAAHALSASSTTAAPSNPAPPAPSVPSAPMPVAAAIPMGPAVPRRRQVLNPAIRRDRIARALIAVVAEEGFANTRLELVLKRAGMSRKAFFEQYDSLQDGFLALLDLARERPAQLIKQEFSAADTWQEGVLYALASLLVYFESEPQLTRIWFVECLAAGTWSLKRREEIASELRTMIVEHWVPKVTEPPPEPVAAAGVMASILGLIHEHVITERTEPLTDLLPTMMQLVTSLYLDKAAVEREAARGAQLAHEIQAGDPRHAQLGKIADPAKEQAERALPEILGNPKARRPHQCLLYIDQYRKQPARLSNRAIAAGIGIRYQPQISKLLTDLSLAGLLHKHTEGLGKRNYWQLTDQGEKAVRTLKERDDRVRDEGRADVLARYRPRGPSADGLGGPGWLLPETATKPRARDR
jgi:AcrR family transcriptional regulator